MKKLLTLTLFLSFNSFAITFNIDSMETYHEFYGKHKLMDSLQPDTYITLDCQSFFAKLDYKDKPTETLLIENYIDTDHCEAIYESIHTCFEKKETKCIDSENIHELSCDCK